MSGTLTELLAAWRAYYDAMTPEQQAELARQGRRRYIIAEMGIGSDADEAAYAEVPSAGDTETLARLERESQARQQRAAEALDRMGL